MMSKNNNKPNTSAISEKRKTIHSNTEDLIKEIFVQRNKLTPVNANEEDKPFDEASKKWSMNDKIIDLFANSIEKDQELKGKYAKILIIILVIMLSVLNGIFIAKGLGKLTYSDDTFNIYITAGIAEVFLLVRIIVKYLFKDNLSDALRIILENNNPTQNNNYKNKMNKKKNSNDKNRT